MKPHLASRCTCTHLAAALAVIQAPACHAAPTGNTQHTAHSTTTPLLVPTASPPPACLPPLPQVVLNHRSPGHSEVFGIVLPTKYICWAELVLASLLNPQASFFGHLCGILAGFIHVR
jgi:hypothetical protein